MNLFSLLGRSLRMLIAVALLYSFIMQIQGNVLETNLLNVAHKIEGELKLDIAQQYGVKLIYSKNKIQLELKA
ncbi:MULTISPECIES: hypothetical protein [Sphingobacterium]|nr:hypothetical protein [Sphingobacterium sp. T2]